MGQMPNELIRIIFEFLPVECMHNLRLVGRNFAAMGAPKLFRRLVFHASHASFDRIRAVAAHPQLRIYVKTLV
jgi:hypothetical protein